MIAASVFSTLTHGWSGIAIAYAAVQGPMLGGMAQAHAPSYRLLLSPVLAVPVMIAAGVGAALSDPILLGLGAASSGMAHLAIGSALSAGLGFAAGRLLAHGTTPGWSHQRGALVVPASAARPMSSARGSRYSPDAHPDLRLAGTPVAAADETKHFKIIGTTGTGKSTAISELLGAALARGDRAVIADPDGSYLRRFYNERRNDLILNPFEPRSMKWDLFAEIRNDYDVEQLARSLIPDHEGTDRSWRGYARTFFTAVTQQAHAAGVRDIGELYRLLVVAETDELRTLTRGTAAQPFLDEHNSRMFDSIRSVTSSAVGALKYVAAQRSSQLSLRDWVSSASPERRGVLFIPYRAGQIAALRSVVSAWMRIAMFEAMEKQEGDQRLWFVVDELDALGQIDGLKDTLARVRKFGGRCVLGFQSIAQVASTYGPGEAHTIVENCGNSMILRCSASEGGGTSRFASTLIGGREILRTTVAKSRRPTALFAATTRSEQFCIEPAVMDPEIEQLPDLSGYLKLASRPEWLRVRLVIPELRVASSAKSPSSENARASRITPSSRPAAATHVVAREDEGYDL